MKKTRLQELAGIKKPLNEGNIWDRNEDGSAPTLADTTARYAAMKGQSLDEAQGNDLGAAIKDKSMYREFIDIMDQLTDIWYATGYTKQDIVDYIDGMLPAENTSYNNL